MVGGSIAGCAAAIALTRAGCDVVVYERSQSDLQARGMGIGIPQVAFEELTAEGFLGGDMPRYRSQQRLWVTRDAGAGAVRWRQPFPAFFASWNVVWRELRARVPQGSYRLSASVSSIEPDADGVVLTTEEGTAERFDAVIGADGYKSLARGIVDAGAQPNYVGYVAVRGDVALPELDEPAMTTVVFPGGHGIFYPMAVADGPPRLNWLLYTALPGSDRFSDPTSLPPGSVPGELVESFGRLAGEHLPPFWAEVVRSTPPWQVSIQPLYDCTSEAYALGNVMLAGDAGAVVRPHTGGGAMKAMHDCLALQRICDKFNGWGDVLSAYDEQRRPASNALVEWGQRLGRPMVTHSLPWNAMREADFQEFYSAAQAGRATPYDVRDA